MRNKVSPGICLALQSKLFYCYFGGVFLAGEEHSGGYMTRLAIENIPKELKRIKLTKQG